MLKSVSPNCVSPFEYFVNYCDWYLANFPGSTIKTVLDQLNTFPASQNICCQTCGKNFPGTSQPQPYIFTGVVTKLFNIPLLPNPLQNQPVGESETEPNYAEYGIFEYLFFYAGADAGYDTCCLNIYGAYENLVDYSFDFLDIQKDIDKCCGEKLSQDCFQSLLEYIESEDIYNYIYNNPSVVIDGYTLNPGVVEYGQINGDTLLCDMYDVLSQKPKEVAEEYLRTFLYYGFVVSCVEGQVIITSLETYLEHIGPPDDITPLPTAQLRFVAINQDGEIGIGVEKVSGAVATNITFELTDSVVYAYANCNAFLLDSFNFTLTIPAGAPDGYVASFIHGPIPTATVLKVTEIKVNGQEYNYIGAEDVYLNIGGLFYKFVDGNECLLIP